MNILHTTVAANLFANALSEVGYKPGPPDDDETPLTFLEYLMAFQNTAQTVGDATKVILHILAFAERDIIEGENERSELEKQIADLKKRLQEFCGEYVKQGTELTNAREELAVRSVTREKFDKILKATRTEHCGKELRHCGISTEADLRDVLTIRNGLKSVGLTTGEVARIRNHLRVNDAALGSRREKSKKK